MMNSRSSIPDAETRSALIKSILVLEQRLIAQENNASDEDRHELDALYDTYETSLTKIPLSRCPHSGEVVTMAIDDTGLDGPFWNCERPIRPVPSVPDTLFAYTGGIDFDRLAPSVHHKVRPGPGRVFIVPRLMEIDGMKAVISTLKIGDRRAFTVFYFCNSPNYDQPRLNEWGLNYHVAELREGDAFALNIPDDEADFDFDVIKYIEKGSVFWLAPNDSEMTLRSTVFDYPHGQSNGRDFPVICQNGECVSSFEHSISVSEGRPK